MHNISFMSLLLILVATLVLFGRGKISSIMGELGQGLTAFKKGLAGDTAEESKAQGAIEPPISQANTSATKNLTPTQQNSTTN